MCKQEVCNCGLIKRIFLSAFFFAQWFHRWNAIWRHVRLDVYWFQRLQRNLFQLLASLRGRCVESFQWYKFDPPVVLLSGFMTYPFGRQPAQPTSLPILPINQIFIPQNRYFWDKKRSAYLANCDFVVSPLSSNAYRLVYELMATTRWLAMFR